MKFNNLKILFVLMILGIFLLSGCTKNVIEPVQPIIKEPDVPVKEPVTGTLKIEPILLSGVDTEKLSLAKYYSLDSVAIELKTSQYDLPLKTSQISNYDDFSGKIQLSNEAIGLLNKNGFV